MNECITWTKDGASLLTAESNCTGARVARCSFLGHVATKDAMYRFSQERGLPFFDLTKLAPCAAVQNFTERPALQTA